MVRYFPKFFFKLIPLLKRKSFTWLKSNRYNICFNTKRNSIFAFIIMFENTFISLNKLFKSLSEYASKLFLRLIIQ